MKLTNWFYTKSGDPRSETFFNHACEIYWNPHVNIFISDSLRAHMYVSIKLTKSCCYRDHKIADSCWSLETILNPLEFSYPSFFIWLNIDISGKINFLSLLRSTWEDTFEIRFNCGSGKKTNCMLILFTILLCKRKACEDFMRWNKPLLIFNYMMILPIDTHNLFHRNLLTSRQIVNERTFFIQTLLKREQCSSYVKIYEMKRREASICCPSLIILLYHFHSI